MIDATQEVVVVNKSFQIKCNFVRYNPAFHNNTFPSLNLTKDGQSVITIIFEKSGSKPKLINKRIEWTGDTKTLEFTLDKVQKSDGGDFRCVSDDGNGTIRKSDTTSLLVVGRQLFYFQFVSHKF